jgi:hypothetical protein
MLKLRHKQIRKKLDAVNFLQRARQSGLDNGYTKKIHAYDLLMGFLLMFNKGLYTLESWAACIEQFTGTVVSKQAVSLKIEARYVNFFKELATALLDRHERPPQQTSPRGQSLFEPFRRVLIEDSTCCSLDDSLAEAFPSSGQAATVRVQLCYELHQSQMHSLAVQSYRDNDQKHAPALVKTLKQGDLVIRDLGYFSTEVFRQIAQQKAFFLSRLRYRVNLYDTHSGARIDLLRLGRGQKRLDLEVELGSEHRFKVRLVGIRLSEAKAKQRRRQAKRDRHSKSNHSAHYMASLGWDFFVTNVPGTCWRADQVYQGYRFRWRIEILFKTLKSQLGFARMLQGRRHSQARVEMTIYLMLIYAVLFLLSGYQYWSRRLAGVSLLKYARWLRLYFERLLESESWAVFTASIRRHCLYEKRRKRLNFYELMLLC